MNSHRCMRLSEDHHRSMQYSSDGFRTALHSLLRIKSRCFAIKASLSWRSAGRTLAWWIRGGAHRRIEMSANLFSLPPDDQIALVFTQSMKLRVAQCARREFRMFDPTPYTCLRVTPFSTGCLSTAVNPIGSHWGYNYTWCRWDPENPHDMLLLESRWKEYE